VDFELDVCLHAVRFVKDQDLVKAITKVPQNVQLLKRQAKGWNCEFHSQQGCFGGFANGILNTELNYTMLPTPVYQTSWNSILNAYFHHLKHLLSNRQDSFCNILSLNLRLL